MSIKSIEEAIRYHKHMVSGCNARAISAINNGNYAVAQSAISDAVSHVEVVKELEYQTELGKLKDRWEFDTADYVSVDEALDMGLTLLGHVRAIQIAMVADGYLEEMRKQSIINIDSAIAKLTAQQKHYNEILGAK